MTRPRPVRRALALSALLLGALALPLGAVSTLRAEEDPSGDARFFPLSEVRPGMRGHGLTVKHGTRVERFEIEVIDVVDKFLPKQDVILVRCLGEAFADHQIAQGMSGSPIYFRGRLAGALSYTWAHAKHAIGGVTPIAVMRAEGRRAREGRPTGWLPRTPLRRPPPKPRVAGTLRPIGTPIMVSGFSEAGRARLAESLGRDGVIVCGAPGGGARAANMDAPVVPGAAITVDLMRGDFEAHALGTITDVDGQDVYGFGHTFEQLGETLMPVSVGYVYTVLASRQMSFKMGGRLREIGALVQDRLSGITCRLGEKAPMVPFTATFRNVVTKRSETFRFEVTPNSLYFQRLARAALQQAFERAEGGVTPTTKRFRMTVKIEGMEPWTYEDAIANPVMGFERVMMGLLDRPLNDPSQRPHIESFELDVDIEHTDRRARVRSVTASRDEARPGDTLKLLVLLEKREDGTPFLETLAVTIPDDAPAGDYEITVLGGDYVPAEVGTPRDVADFPKLYGAFWKSTELVALLPKQTVHVDAYGHLLESVPLSSLPRLARSAEGPAMRIRQAYDKVRHAVPYIVDGRQTVSVRVLR